jgi:hypothetical protein
MAMIETNLNKKDKMTIAIFLFIAVIFMFGWFAIRPTILKIREIDDQISQAQIKADEYKSKIIGLSSAEAIFDRAVEDINDSTSDYYEIMASSTIDRMVTSYVLSFDLYPEDLYITMPTGPIDEIPYLYSQAAYDQAALALAPTPVPTPVTTSTLDAASQALTGTTPAASGIQVQSLLTPYDSARMACTSTSSSGVVCADLTMVMTGDRNSCQALIDDLCTKPAVRITGFTWSQVEPTQVVNPDTGVVELVESESMRLQVSVRLYMTNVVDYRALVSDATAAAGAEG